VLDGPEIAQARAAEIKDFFAAFEEAGNVSG
jgi:hypothetical protein